MSMSTSSEFITLCQSQVALLTQGLEAALSVVYLTEELVEGVPTKLRPVVAYPQTAVEWETDEISALGFSDRPLASIPRLLSAASPVPQESDAVSETGSTESAAEVGKEETIDELQAKAGTSPLQRSLFADADLSSSSRQIVVPLLHEGVVMGLLVTAREDRPWNQRERTAIERIADTLASACILDRRSQWFEQQLSQQRHLQAQQRDLMDDLIHQFRNPMTALRTFGKLLLRRLVPGDANREVANSIVRESDRLQELLLQFDRAVDMDEGELVPLYGQIADRSYDAVPVPIAPSCPLPPKDEDLGNLYSPLGLEPQTIPTRALALESCSVAKVLEPLVVTSSAIAQEKNLALLAEIPPNLPPVQANAKVLREVLSNLIDNALKYTPAGGQVYIQAGNRRHTSQGDFQAIAISDTGPGIPVQDKEHLFERHYRGVQAETEIPGSGLGLAIARDLVEQMQGEIEVISPAERNWLDRSIPHTQGPGTTFIVWLLTEALKGEDEV
ncbi:sensor histidine kinase [Coleofasciculus sp. FACHB-64]|nr:sensor histidine kinase [Coleofasciculus sp. FACHB-501]MBD2045220.1 sensor histidine kinase [Coleofasciculus sp. FACHB-64]